MPNKAYFSKGGKAAPLAKGERAMLWHGEGIHGRDRTIGHA